MPAQATSSSGNSNMSMNGNRDVAAALDALCRQLAQHQNSSGANATSTLRSTNSPRQHNSPITSKAGSTNNLLLKSKSNSNASSSFAAADATTNNPNNNNGQRAKSPLRGGTATTSNGATATAPLNANTIDAALEKAQRLLEALQHQKAAASAEGGGGAHDDDDDEADGGENAVSLAIPSTLPTATSTSRDAAAIDAQRSNNNKAPPSSSSSSSPAAAAAPSHSLPNPPYALATLIPNALITTHVASTLFIMLDTLASTVRASWGMLYMYNDTLQKLVLVASCGQRYARPGSVTIAVATNHFQPSLLGAAAAASTTAPSSGGVIGLGGNNSGGGDSSPLRPRPPNAAPINSTTAAGGSSSSSSIESRVLETGIGLNITVTATTATTAAAAAGSSADSGNGAAMRNVTAVDGMYHAREMAMILSSNPLSTLAGGGEGEGDGGDGGEMGSAAHGDATSKKKSSSGTKKSAAAAAAAASSSLPSSSSSPSFPTTASKILSAAASHHDAKVRLSALVAKAHRTRNVVMLPLFRPGSQNTEVIGLLELGNKVGDEAFMATSAGGGGEGGVAAADGDGGNTSPQQPSFFLDTVPFTADDECRAVEAAAFMANILVKYPHELGHRNSHNHGINDKLAMLVAGLPSYDFAAAAAATGGGSGADGKKKQKQKQSPSSLRSPNSIISGTNNNNTAGSGSGGDIVLNHTFNYFGAAVLRTNALRAPQLIYRSDRDRMATVKKAEMRAGSTAVSFKGGADEWREVTLAQQSQRNSNSNSSATAASSGGGGGAAPAAAPSSSSSSSSKGAFSPATFTAAQQPPPIATSPQHPLRPQHHYGRADPHHNSNNAAAALVVEPPAFLPQLPTGATVTDAIEHTLQMGESWRNAVMLNVELETEMRRLHEALRISRREVARLQDMLLSVRQNVALSSNSANVNNVGGVHLSIM